MSELYKLRYEVISILKENILKGLESFGVPISEKPGDEGWLCMESDQPSYRNIDKGVIFFQESAERIGWQSTVREYNGEKDNFDVIDYFIEQQIWKIKVLYRSSTETITDDNIPITNFDVSGMLIAWFNRLGCMEFRKHNMANLFIQNKEVKTYKDPSDASQWITEFPLKLQVIKQFETELDTAEPFFAGAVPIEGTAPKKIVKIENGKVVDITREGSDKPNPIIKRIFKRLGNLLSGIFQRNPSRVNVPQKGMDTTIGDTNGN